MAINWGQIIEKASQFGQKAVGKVKEVSQAVGKEVGNIYQGITKGGTYDTSTKQWSTPEERVPMPPTNRRGMPAQTPSASPIPKEIQRIIQPEVMAASATPMPSMGRNPNYDKKVIKPPVSNAIRKASTTFNVPEDLLFDISFSESSHDPKKLNPSAAPGLNPVGLFQFTDNTWKDIINGYARNPNSSLYGILPNEDRTDPVTNALAAAYLIAHGQLGKWDASEHNWGNYWSPAELEDLGYYDQSIYHVKGVRPSVRLAGGQ